MADRKISDLTALTAPASGDYLPIVDISEAAAASKNKRVTIQSLFQGIPVPVGIGTSSPLNTLHISGGVGTELYVESTATSGGTIRCFNTSGSMSFGMSGAASNTYLLYDRTNSHVAYLYNGGATGSHIWYTNNTERLRLDSSGRVGIGISAPTTLLDVNADTVRVRTARTPASATATGATGEICWDANYIYICTATNTWRRSAISSW